MRTIADLHIHSHYSRATSKNLNFFHLTKWAQIKGIQLLITGDISHPGWLAEMHENLVPAEGRPGLFRVKDELARAVAEEVPAACQQPVYYMLGGEISGIYKKNDRVRKVHNMIYAPSLEAVEQIQAALEKIGNIRSDGRPILGLPCRDLLEIILDIDDQNYLIPAHIWTPWFSLLGSKSGYDTVEECYEDLSEHIFAVESGLSSDPPMNELVSMLDKYTLVSHSDAHSAQKLGREADIFTIDLSYPTLFDALKSGNRDAFWGTLEFFPEEGKYHYDGHRKCQVCWRPKETIAHDALCTGCGKKVTVGVMHRVQELADREEAVRDAMPADKRRRFHSLVPLPELLSEIQGVGPTSKRVQKQYFELLDVLGAELSILLELPLEEIAQKSTPLLAEGIRRMRASQVHVQSGYDGEYGVIKVFTKEELAKPDGQLGLFEVAGSEVAGSEVAGSEVAGSKVASAPSLSLVAENVSTDVDDTQPDLPAENAPTDATNSAPRSASGRNPRRSASHNATPACSADKPPTSGNNLFAKLNPQQLAAAHHTDGPMLIVAGPGTGKTRTLTVRIANLVTNLTVPPEEILAITFTNKAAQEMSERLRGLLGAPTANRITACTFHALGAQLLRTHGDAIGLPPEFIICTEEDRKTLLKSNAPELSERERSAALEQISAMKSGPHAPLRASRPESLSKGDEQGSSLEPPSDGSLAQASERPYSLKKAEEGLGFIYQLYNEALRANQMVDFDDLILLTVELLEQDPATLQQLRARFRWISVDEYQDVNHIQYRLLRLLTGEQTNLCAIGDPDQAIYGFRGADRSYFLRFPDDFPGAQRVELEQNYRSSQMILDASHQVIVQEAGRDMNGDAVRIWSEFVEQTKLDVYPAHSDKAEAEYVVHQIEQMVGGTSYFSLDSGRVDDENAYGENTMARSFGDFAVLVRLGAQMPSLVEAFERSGIPYQAVGRTPLVEEKPIQEILAYLWLLANPSSEFLRDKVEKRLKAPLLIEPLIMEMREKVGTLSVTDFINTFDAFILEQHPKQDKETRREQVQRFGRVALSYEARLLPFLEAMALQREADVYDARAARVAIMTLHASKGLEFPVVFMVGCEETLMPYQFGKKTTDVDEERRLFYVGMTRAQEKIVLCHAKSRFLFGQLMKNPASRFVNDIENSLKELKQLAPPKPKKAKPDELQLSLFGNS